MKINRIIYLIFLFLISNSCTHRENSISVHAYTGYGFFYFKSEKDNNFELCFIPVGNSKDELMSFNSDLSFKTGLSFVCNVKDSGFVDKIRYYSKKECQIIINNNYSVDYKTIAYYNPVYISYKIQDGINNTDSLKTIEESILKNGRKSVFRFKLLDTKKDVSNVIKVDKIIFLDTTLTEARKKFGLRFNNIRRRLFLPELPVNWKYTPSFTIGNTVEWENSLNRNCPSPFFGGKSVAYINDSFILSEQNIYSGPLSNGIRQVLFETYYFVDIEGGKKHSRKYSFSFNPNDRMLTNISKFQADSVLKAWKLKSTPFSHAIVSHGRL